MRRTALLAVLPVLFLLAGCQDALPPDGDVALRVSDGAHTDPTMGGDPNANPYFYFLPPLVESPTYDGIFNPYLKPVVKIVELGTWLRDANGNKVPQYDPFVLRCDEGSFSETPVPVTVDAVNQRYSVGWDTDMTEVGKDYRICVEAEGVILGYRDVRPDASGADVPRNTAQLPVYEYNQGSNIPIKFRIEAGATCVIDGVQVEDCTQVWLGPAGGTGVCANATCGLLVPATAILPDEEYLFTIERVTCPTVNEDGADYVDYLDIDLPQFAGCLRITVEGETFFEGFEIPSVAATCADVSALPVYQQELVQLHAQYASGAVFSLPTAASDFLGCTDFGVPAPAGLGSQVASAARTGWRALRGALGLPMAPPSLQATHKGFGGSTTLSDAEAGVSAALSEPGVAAAAPAQLQLEPTQAKLVWALPAQMERFDWVTNPKTAAVGELLEPTVKVWDDPSKALDPNDLDPRLDPEPVEGTRVIFTLPDGSTDTARTDNNGLASTMFTPTLAGEYTITATGRGIGLTLQEGGTGAFADHLNPPPVRLETKSLDFVASICSDKSFLLDEGVNPADYDGGVDIPINLSSSAAETAFMYWATDCYRTYFALVIPEAPSFTNTLRLVFVDDLETRFPSIFSPDPMNPGQFAAVPVVGDDMWKISWDTDRKSATYQSWVIEDWHVADDCTGSSKQSECGKADILAGGTDDLVGGTGGAAYPWDNATIYEFAIEFPADPADEDPFDFQLPAIGQSTWIGFYAVLQRGNGAQADMEYPDFRIFQPIQIVRQ
jgi:hypothetical protein